MILYLKSIGKSEILDFVGSAYRVSDAGIWSKIEPDIRNELSNKSLKAMLEFFVKNNYKFAEKEVRGFLLDNQISKFRDLKDNSKWDLFKLSFRAIYLKDLNRLKTILKLLWR